jgi:CheY-like chemotaxis protein
VIDDEERIREIVQVCLEELAGWQVSKAATGQDGLARAQAEAIDAILLDISMPDIDGLRLVQQLQAQPETRSIPVILLTAKPLPTDPASWAEIGIAGVIAKPFNALTFPTQISNLLGWEQKSG